MSVFLNIENVVKSYASHVALNGVTFDVPEHSVFGLLGPNGAGKTSLIRIINQITAADSGRILFKGSTLDRSHISGIGYLPEERGLYKKMTVLDQIIYFARLKDIPADEVRNRANAWLERFDIQSWRQKKIEELSKGMQQKVQFITTVIHNPELIILDEPFSGFDPINTELIKSEILRLRKEGATIIFSTHRMESVEEICDHIAMINRSQLVLNGSVKEIKNRFSENKVAIEYSGTLQEEPPNLMETSLLPNGNTQAIVLLMPSQSSMEVVSRISGKVQIHAFREIVPAMNEIFIQTVNRDNA